MGGGGAHTSASQPWDWGCAPPQISEFCLGLGGGTKVFYPPRQDYSRFKIPSFTSLSHTHSPVCAPTAPFSFSRIVGNLLSSRSRAIDIMCFPIYALPYILAISYNPWKRLYFFLEGGGGTHSLLGGGTCAPKDPPTLWVRHWHCFITVIRWCTWNQIPTCMLINAHEIVVIILILERRFYILRKTSTCYAKKSLTFIAIFFSAYSANTLFHVQVVFGWWQ